MLDKKNLFYKNAEFEKLENKATKNTPETRPRSFKKIKSKRSIVYTNQTEGLRANKNYTVINELTTSDYFGEISVLTKLPATATIHVVSHTVCCELSSHDFQEFVNNFSDCKMKIEKKIHSYSDSYFRRLHRIMGNIPYLWKLDYASTRDLILNMCKYTYSKESVI